MNINYHNKIFVFFLFNDPYARACILFNCRSGLILWPFRKNKNKMNDCKQLPPLGYTQLKQQNTTTTKQKD